jgi:hypothetical protein
MAAQQLLHGGRAVGLLLNLLLANIEVRSASKLAKTLVYKNVLKIAKNGLLGKYYYYEIVEFCRKGLLTGVLLGAKQGSASQIAVGVFICAVFAFLNMTTMPYVDRRVNGMRILTDFSLFVTMLCVLLLHFREYLQCEFMNEHLCG